MQLHQENGNNLKLLKCFDNAIRLIKKKDVMWERITDGKTRKWHYHESPSMPYRYSACKNVRPYTLVGRGHSI